MKRYILEVFISDDCEEPFFVESDLEFEELYNKIENSFTVDKEEPDYGIFNLPENNFQIYCCKKFRLYYLEDYLHCLTILK